MGLVASVDFCSKFGKVGIKGREFTAQSQSRIPANKGGVGPEFIRCL